MFNYWKQITNAKSLTELSQNIHILIIGLLLLQNIFVTIFRYINFNILIVYINFAEIAVYIIAGILFFKKHYKASILVAAYGIPIIFSVVSVIMNFPFKTTLWFFLGYQIIYLLIIRQNNNRIFYALFCAAIFHIPGIIITFNYPENIIKFIQIFTLTLVPLIISIFIENQDKKLQLLNEDLLIKYKEKESYAKEIENKNQELIVFSHIMSHDLKSPLRTIKSFANLLHKNLEKKDITSKDLEHLNFISMSANAMNDLIEDLLLYSKIQVKEFEMEYVDLHNVISTVLPSFQFDILQKNATINVKDLPIIYGDIAMLKTVFYNLISNAIKYQPKDKENHYPAIHIWSVEDEENHFIFLQDNGIGIEEEYKKNLFTPFRRYHASSKYQGTGLGMSICRRIVLKHNGDIRLKTTSRQGSTFQITFPKTNKPAIEVSSKKIRQDSV